MSVERRRMKSKETNHVNVWVLWIVTALIILMDLRAKETTQAQKYNRRSLHLHGPIWNKHRWSYNYCTCVSIEENSELFSVVIIVDSRKPPSKRGFPSLSIAGPCLHLLVHQPHHTLLSLHNLWLIHRHAIYWKLLLRFACTNLLDSPLRRRSGKQKQKRSVESLASNKNGKGKNQNRVVNKSSQYVQCEKMFHRPSCLHLHWLRHRLTHWLLHLRCIDWPYHRFSRGSSGWSTWRTIGRRQKRQGGAAPQVRRMKLLSIICLRPPLE